MWWYWAAKGTADTANYLADFVEYKTQRSLLKTQASVYKQNAASALAEGRKNAQKVYNSGEQAQGTLLSDYGASGVDVNNSQTVSTAQRTLQKGINDDVYSVMYNAATEANQHSINAQIAKYQAKQLKKGFILQSIGTWANNAANAGKDAMSMYGGGS